MIDRLIDKIEKTGNPSVVGLDPVYEMIPANIRKEMLDSYGKTPKAVAEMFIAFNKGLIGALCDIAPAVKPQIAMYEKYGLEGVRAYIETASYAKEKGMVVIGDLKRGDIATTAAAYAAHIGGVTVEGEAFDLWNEDAVTLNPYMGFDGIEPFIKPCNDLDKGIFVLVKTSNPSSADVQDIEAPGGPLFERVAALVAEWGKLAMGGKGYSRVGAVVGATYKEQGEKLRKMMPSTFFLVPGYGAQGGKGSDIKGFFGPDGRGCIVNSSRGIIAAYKNDRKYSDADFADAARNAALKMKGDIAG
ncbi:MAG: orotidine-5'-phosphate decarboxylase [Clostridiales bacterium]|nr:orotidine-5'-phosphate decarboxylase [Clostridiales bacterium]